MATFNDRQKVIIRIHVYNNFAATMHRILGLDHVNRDNQLQLMPNAYEDSYLLQCLIGRIGGICG